MGGPNPSGLYFDDYIFRMAFTRSVNFERFGSSLRRSYSSRQNCAEKFVDDSCFEGYKGTFQEAYTLFSLVMANVGEGLHS